MIRNRLSLSDIPAADQRRDDSIPRHRIPASGYGRKIPTSVMVRLDGRWRRVYACQISNACTCYVPNRDGSWTVIVD